jgi:hypothetical protein
VKATIFHRWTAIAVTVAVPAVLTLSTTTMAAAATPLLQTDVRTVVVNWGSQVDPAQASAAAGVLDALDNSGYLRGLAAEYSLSSRAEYLGGGIIRDEDLPATTSNATIDSALAAGIAGGSLPAPSGSTNYVVMLPPGVAPANSATPFCSSHHAFTVSGRRAYALVVSDFGTTADQCGGAPSDAVSAASVNVTRQLVNAVTNPLASSAGVHQTGTGSDIADACAASASPGNVDGFAVQPWWSNKNSNCSFGDTSVGVTPDVDSVTNSTLATFRLHDTATSSSTSFGCTFDEAAVSCGTSHPLVLTGVAVGSHTLDVSVSGLGNATYTWLVDLSAPAATLLTPTAPVTVGKTVTVSYSGTDTGGAGVAAYDVRYRTAAWNGGFGRWVQPPAWQATPKRHVSLAVQPGHVYCFAVRAQDRADNVSASWSATRCTTVPVDDRTMTATAGWHRTKATTAFRGTLSTATTNGARLRLAKAHVRRVALVVRTCPTCGRITVYRGGVVWRTVSTKRAATHNRVVIMLPAIGLRTTAISLQVVGSGKPVYVDGLAILQT